MESATIMYIVMAAVGAGLCMWGHGSLRSILTPAAESDELLKQGIISGLAIGVLFAGSYSFRSWFPSFDELRKVMMTILGDLSVLQATYLAGISSIAEEILFRGAIQPYAGIAMTSILFGLLHIGPRGNISTWSLWALLSGLLLGQIVESTGSILPAVVIHFGVNLISFLSLRRDWSRLTDVDKRKMRNALASLKDEES